MSTTIAKRRKKVNTAELPACVTREFAISREAVDVESRTVELAFSSETPYERWWGMEILDHSPGAMRDTRLNGAAALLMNHDRDQQVGAILRAWVDGKDRKGRAEVKFSRSEFGEEIFQDVQDEIRQLVSVSYLIHEMRLESSGDDGETYRITDWEPLEISIVAIPADATVGVGRDFEVPATPALPVQERKTMDTVATTPENRSATPPVDIRVIETNALQSERDRQQQIRALAELHQQRDFGLEACNSGMTLDQFRGALLERIARSPSLQQPESAIGMTPKQTENYSLFRLLNALSEPTNRAAQEAAAFEFEAHRAVAAKIGYSKNGGVYVPWEIQNRHLNVSKRDLTVGTANAGGYLVATDNLGGSFIDMLRNRALVAQLGARMLPDLVGNVTIPKQTAAATAYWLTNEATAITESQLTLGQVALSPKTVGALTEVSRLLMLQSSPAAEQLVMDDLAQVIALAIDAAAIAGPGTGGAPTGVIGTSGVGAVTGTSLAYAGIVEFQTDVAGGNALAENSAYVTTPAVAGLLMGRQRFSSTDTPLWTGTVLDGQMGGYRAAATNQMPTDKMVFGDWSQVIIGMWGVLELKATESHSTNFAAGITTIRAMASVDIAVRIAAAFSVAASIT